MSAGNSGPTGKGIAATEKQLVNPVKEMAVRAVMKCTPSSR